MMPDKSDDFSDVAESAFWLSTQARSAWSFTIEARPFGEMQTAISDSSRRRLLSPEKSPAAIGFLINTSQVNRTVLIFRVH